MRLKGCDTFVAMSDVVEKNTGLVFGKNSDRPRGEVQEVVYARGRDVAEEGEQVQAGCNHVHTRDIMYLHTNLTYPFQCTYISVPQLPTGRRTLDCVLSKPCWMWGAEMGVNSTGVAVGNEAVWNRTNDYDYDVQKRLLGMDLVRLGLERGRSGEEALEVITSMLEVHGQVS